MDKSKLRKADFITSILLLAFSIWMFFKALKMPINDTFLGVPTTLSTSPALFPFIISIALFVFGIMLFVIALKAGAVSAFFRDLNKKSSGISDNTIRFSIIVLAIFTFIYLYIPRVDFYVAVYMFLMYTISTFYFEDLAFMKKITLVYIICSVVFFLVVVTGAGTALNSLFMYSTDVLALAVSVLITVYSGKYARRAVPEINRKRFRAALLVAILIPAVLAPVFRYFLRVPLPHEGGLINLMHNIYYGLR